MRLREGPVQLASRLDIAPSTVHRILKTAHLNRLSYLDRATGEPVRRYEHPHPGSLVHVDVKKVATSQTAAAGVTSAAARARRTAPSPLTSRAISTAAPNLGTRTCTPSSTTTRVSRTQRLVVTRRPSPPSLSFNGRWSGSPTVALPSSACCRTTAARTGRTFGATPARPCQSHRSARARAVLRPTARWNASTAPWLTGGPTPTATAASRNDAMPSPTGFTSTTSTVRTQPATTSRPSHD